MHHHSHHHHSHDTTAEANRAHFDGDGGSVLHTPDAKKVAAQAAQALTEVVIFDSNVTRAVDFACGIGTQVISHKD